MSPKKQIREISAAFKLLMRDPELSAHILRLLGMVHKKAQTMDRGHLNEALEDAFLAVVPHGVPIDVAELRAVARQSAAEAIERSAATAKNHAEFLRGCLTACLAWWGNGHLLREIADICERFPGLAGR